MYMCECGVLPLPFPFWVLRKPAFIYTFFLLEEFADAPEGGGTEDAEDRGPEDAFDEEGAHGAGNADEEVGPPYLCAEIVFCLDYDRVPDADCEECADGDENSGIVHKFL